MLQDGSRLVGATRSELGFPFVVVEHSEVVTDDPLPVHAFSFSGKRRPPLTGANSYDVVLSIYPSTLQLAAIQ